MRPGYCFMDAAVRDIWSDSGLSKQVNRATSLRNFVKMLLVADGMISPDQTGSDTMKEISAIARQEASPFIRTLPEMQETMIANGFLLLNAALVFRPHVAVGKRNKGLATIHADCSCKRWPKTGKTFLNYRFSFYGEKWLKN